MITSKELDKAAKFFKNDNYTEFSRNITLSIKNACMKSKEINDLVVSIVNRSKSIEDSTERAILAGIIIGIHVWEDVNKSDTL